MDSHGKKWIFERNQKAALPVESTSSGVVTPSQAFTRKISRLIVAVAIFTYRVIVHVTTRGEACHWILGRLRLPMNPVPLPPLEMTTGGKSQ